MTNEQSEQIEEEVVEAAAFQQFTQRAYNKEAVNLLKELQKLQQNMIENQATLTMVQVKSMQMMIEWACNEVDAAPLQNQLDFIHDQVIDVGQRKFRSVIRRRKRSVWSRVAFWRGIRLVRVQQIPARVAPTT